MRLVLDIGGTKIAAAHVADGLLQDRRQLPMPATEAEFMQAIASLAAGRPPIGSAAVAVTGYTDGTLVRGINWKTIGFWDGFPLVPRLVDLLGCPVTVLNDAQAAAWAEYEARRHEVKDLLFITLSTEVGGGLVLDGRLREGRQGLAHVGHMAFDVMPLDATDRAPIVCGCGRTGCLEAVASRTALARQARTAFGKELNSEALFNMADQGTALAEAIVSNAAKAVASAIGSCHSQLDLQCVVLGGSVGLGHAGPGSASPRAVACYLPGAGGSSTTGR